MLGALNETLAVLLSSPAESPNGEWWASVVGQLRGLLGANGGLLYISEHDGEAYCCAQGLPGEVTHACVTWYQTLRAGGRNQELGLPDWTQSGVWDPEAVARTRFAREFLASHGLHSPLGVTLHLNDIRTHSYTSFFYNDVSASEVARERAALLELIAPALQNGVGMKLRIDRWLRFLPAMLDVIGQRLSLFDLRGREMHRNAALRRALAEDPDCELLANALREVATAEIARVGQGPTVRARTAVDRSRSTRREVRTRQSRYRLRGNLIGPELVGPGAAILVSLDRVSPEVPARDVLRTRYNLTDREAEVARLLFQRLSNREISRVLGISPHTARHHTENVLIKVGVNSRRELISSLTASPAGAPVVARTDL
jgi:DNA-binding CsgD family transcriptional regulator